MNKKLPIIFLFFIYYYYLHFYTKNWNRLKRISPLYIFYTIKMDYFTFGFCEP